MAEGASLYRRNLNFMDGQQQNNYQNNNSGGQNQGGGPAMGAAQAQAKESMNALESWMAPLFEKLPHLPEGGRKFLVTIAPWYALIFGVLGMTALLGLLALLGMGSAMGGLGAYGMGVGYGVGDSLVMLLFGIASSLLLLMAFKGLKAGQKGGWNFLFYAEVVSVAGSVVAVVMTGGYGILGTVIGALIGFYLIFEVRSHYK